MAAQLHIEGYLDSEGELYIQARFKDEGLNQGVPAAQRGIPALEMHEAELIDCYLNCNPAPASDSELSESEMRSQICQRIEVFCRLDDYKPAELRLVYQLSSESKLELVARLQKRLSELGQLRKSAASS